MPDPGFEDLEHTLDKLLDHVVDEVWSGQLGLPAAPAGTDAGGPDPARALSGTVRIHGAWDGLLVLTCPAELARRAGAQLFGTEPSTPAELLDLLGEVTNVTAGNLAGLLPGLTRMSVPAVEPGPGPDHDRPRRRYTCGEATFSVALIPTEHTETR